MQLIQYKNLYQSGTMALESIFLSANMSCAIYQWFLLSFFYVAHYHG